MKTETAPVSPAPFLFRDFLQASASGVIVRVLRKPAAEGTVLYLCFYQIDENVLGSAILRSFQQRG